jgi:cytochrome c oxidase accessory protein FixG
LSTLLEPDERVLSTLEKDGSRRWLNPRLSGGDFLKKRRAVAYILILIFTLTPYLRLNGKPLVLLDVIHRQFTLFGYTFLPTDTILLALFIVAMIVGVFLMTALFGRVWCGWACPQTVYMEFVYRPIERLFEGTRGRGGKPRGKVAGWRRAAKFAVYLLVSMFLAHTFLAYFVGIENLVKWMTHSPFKHPVAFTVMAATTGLMLFDFGVFREQTCIIACPYGRLQSVMLDRQSLIVTYDTDRGEPRGKKRKDENDTGDCVACNLCVDTCPTGIDIREGTQMECIGCAQCVDACAPVMAKLGRPPGLIRYSTQAAMEGEKPRLIRPRVIIYPTIMVLVLTLFLFMLGTKKPADVLLLRSRGTPFTVMEDGHVANAMRIKITNRMDEAASYTVKPADERISRIEIAQNPLLIGPGESRTEGVLVVAPRSAFLTGSLNVHLQISDGQRFDQQIACRLLGPSGPVSPTAATDAPTSAGGQP